MREWLARLDSNPDKPLSTDEQARLRVALRAFLDGDHLRPGSGEPFSELPESVALLNASLELKETIDDLLRLALPRFADWASVDLFDERNILRTFAVQHSDPKLQRLALGMENRAHFDDLVGPRGVPKVARTGEYDLMVEVPKDFLDEGVPDPNDRALYRTWGLASGLVVPLRSRGRLIGVLAFYFGHSDRHYSEADVIFVQQFADRAAHAIDNARMYERAHKVADTLQLATLPSRLPRIPGVVFDKAYYPAATESEVGGDWYDAFLLSDGRLAFSIGDVGGKGLDAAVLMSEMRHSIRANALDERCTPADVLDRANRLLSLSGAGLMVTAFFGFLDPVSLHLTYASAGHPGPVLVGKDGRGRILPTDGLPLGIDFVDIPRVFSEQLETGALLVLYTDGLLEFDRDIIRAEQRIIQAAIALHAERPLNIAAALERRVLNDAIRKDDIAILSIYLDDQPTTHVDVTLPAVAPSAALVRRAIEHFGQGIGLDENSLFELQVSVGEAVINSIEHAYRSRGGEFTVKLDALGDIVSVLIEDHGAWRAVVPSTEPVLDRERGRGFFLMNAFAEDVRVRHTAHGTTVRFISTIVFDGKHRRKKTSTNGNGNGNGNGATTKSREAHPATLP